MDEDRIYIKQMAKRLKRAENTIRQWVNQNLLPAELMPNREGGRAKIFWTDAQIPGLKKFARERAARRGWQH